MKTQTRLPVVRICEVAGFTRAGYYRFLDPEKPAPADMDLRDQIQKIALEWPSYGSRRIKRELKDRGWDVHRKRVQRLMREHNLLCVVKQVRGDDRLGARTEGLSEPSEIDDPDAGVDQLWVADITYIRLNRNAGLVRNNTEQLWLV